MQSEHLGERPFVDNAFGGNCAFTRRMWEQLGRFDEGLSGHGDETEFFLRAWAGGYRVRWASGAVVNCRLRPGLRVMARQRYRKGKSLALMATRPGGRLLQSDRRRSGLKPWAYVLLMAPLAVVSTKIRFPWVRLTFCRVGRLVGRIELWRGRQ